MKTILIEIEDKSLNKELSLDDLKQDILDVDFKGEYMIRIEKRNNKDWVITNAMNGWGYNCFDEFIDSKVIITPIFLIL